MGRTVGSSAPLPLVETSRVRTSAVVALAGALVLAGSLLGPVATATPRGAPSAPSPVPPAVTDPFATGRPGPTTGRAAPGPTPTDAGSAEAAVRAAAAAAVAARAQARAAATAAGTAAAAAEAALSQWTRSKASLRAAQTTIDAAVRAAYHAGPVSELGLLTGSDSPSDVLQGRYVGDVVAREALERLTGARRAVERAEISRTRAEATRAIAAREATTAVAAAAAAAAAEQRAREKALQLQREAAKRLLASVGLLPSAAQSPALLAAASGVKEVTPFAPGSGPNSNDRMSEWLASDRTVVAGTPRAHAVSQLGRFGWGLTEWACLDRMWWHESGWSPYSVDHAQGGTDGVIDPAKTWGIPQAYPASKMADLTAGGGPDWVTNPATQIGWGLTYIARRYGSPCQAWASWRAIAATGRAGWY